MQLRMSKLLALPSPSRAESPGAKYDGATSYDVNGLPPLGLESQRYAPRLYIAANYSF